MNNKYKFRMLTIIIIICLCAIGTMKSIQNDTFYIIKLGDFIVHHGVDGMDHYSWVANLPYTYPHWLYDVLIYYIYDCFGYFGIYFFNILLFVLLILLIYYINLRLHGNEFLASFVSIVSVSSILGFATARAQLLSIILFSLEVYWLEMLNKKGKNKYILYLLIGSLLIANIHGTAWLMYFVLFLPFLVEDLICFFCKRKRFKIFIFNTNNNLKKTIIAFLGSFTMGIFTPNRICYTYVFRVMLGDSQDYIIEHAPIIIFDHPLLLVVVFIMFLFFILVDVKIYFKELFMIIGLMFLSFMSARHLIFFYVIGLLYLINVVVRSLNDKDNRSFDVLINMLCCNKILFPLVIIVVLLSGFVFIDNNKEYVLKNEYPVDAVKYIKDNLDYKKIKLYNDYFSGSYLLFNDIPVFIDSRCDLYLKEFNGMRYSIFDDYVNMYKNYESKFDDYDVQYVLLNKRELLFVIINKDSNYKIEYEDKYFALFKRNIYE